jgi:DNA-binding response OmpR family regulator
MPTKHLLVVDDDAAMRELIADYLRGRDWEVSAAADGREMARILAERAVDLVILDLRLANEDGLELLRGLGEEPKTPVIILTGHRPDEADRIIGLELGADDYMTKPFSLRELHARIRAVLRRAKAGAHSNQESGKRTRYRFAGWELSMRTRQLMSPARDRVPLTAGEFNLLAASCSHRSRC